MELHGIIRDHCIGNQSLILMDYRGKILGKLSFGCCYGLPQFLRAHIFSSSEAFVFSGEKNIASQDNYLFVNSTEPKVRDLREFMETYLGKLPFLIPKPEFFLDSNKNLARLLGPDSNKNLFTILG